MPCSCAAFQRLGDLPGDRQRFLEWKRPLRDPIRERRPLDEFHDERGDATGILESVDLCDVWIVQCRQRPGLALETSQALRIRCHAGRQDLDRHVAIEARVTGAIDLAHSAASNQLDDVVRPDARATRQAHSETPGLYAYRRS